MLCPACLPRLAGALAVAMAAATVNQVKIIMAGNIMYAVVSSVGGGALPK